MNRYRDEDEKDNGHRGKECIADLWLTDVIPECKHEHNRNEKDGKVLHLIGKVVRVLEWMRRVWSKVAAAVRSELFDSNHRSDGTAGNIHGIALKRDHFFRALEGGGRPLHNQEESDYQRQRKQYACAASEKQLVEISKVRT